MAYAGHQFAGWSPQLGDGRALLVGELMHADGARRDLVLKGSGRTAFSRGGDGKATLGSVLREYIVSEAMAALGVPTTRALAAVTTGETIVREAPQPGAVFARVAHSHVRVGTFQYFYARGDAQAVRTLADYVIDRHYPEARANANAYRGLCVGVFARQAELIARWMSLGFIHGVMNTDNVQVAGETLDFGPCAFIDVFHPAQVFSSIDRGGRYAWGNQPGIAQWNLTRFAETMLPLIDADEKRAIAWVEEALAGFLELFAAHFERLFRQKLGLAPDAEEDDFISSTLTLLAKNEVDFTLFFRQLTRVAGGAEEDELRGLFATGEECDAWLTTWRARLSADALVGMRRANPVFIPRNHRVEEAIQAANAGDYVPFHRLVEVLQRPYEEQPEHAELERAPEAHEVVHHTFCGT